MTSHHAIAMRVLGGGATAAEAVGAAIVAECGPEWRGKTPELHAKVGARVLVSLWEDGLVAQHEFERGRIGWRLTMAGHEAIEGVTC